MSTLIERKQHMIALMREIHGNDYLLGWLEGAYLRPLEDPVAEESVIARTIAELEEIKECSKNG